MGAMQNIPRKVLPGALFVSGLVALVDRQVTNRYGTSLLGGIFLDTEVHFYCGGGGGLVVLDDELSGYFSNEFKINSLSTVICGAYFGHISTGLIYLRLHVGIFDDFVPCFDIRILEIH